MKKLLAVSLIALSANSFAGVVTSVTFGPYINCLVHNNTSSWITVDIIDYDIMTQGGLKNATHGCSFNCDIAPYTTQQFSGPINSYLVTGATCNARYNW